DEVFVRALYRDQLGRAAGQQEVNVWANYVTVLGQAAVARLITNCTEAHDHQVRQMYADFLGRSANGVEELPWVRLLDNGSTWEQVASRILGSFEFEMRANALEGTPDGYANYVRALYRVLLLRTGSAVSSGEVQLWESQLR